MNRSGYSVRFVKPDRTATWFAESYIELVPKGNDIEMQAALVPLESEALLATI